MRDEVAVRLLEHIRDVPDFPTPGITFKDITPLLGAPQAFSAAIDELVVALGRGSVDKVVGIEARGFIIAAPVAYHMAAGFVPVRKKGKLPWETVERSYTLEYGAETLQMHTDAVRAGDRVAIVDDVLATGGTAEATAELVASRGATVAGMGFLIEIEALGGRARLAAHDPVALLTV